MANNTDPATIIAHLQRELTALQERMNSMRVAPSTDADRVLDVVKKSARPVTYGEIAKATGLTQSVINTIAKKHAFRRKLVMTLEPGQGNRLVYVLRRPEACAFEDQLPGVRKTN
jgi:hypothetical protein